MKKQKVMIELGGNTDSFSEDSSSQHANLHPTSTALQMETDDESIELSQREKYQKVPIISSSTQPNQSDTRKRQNVTDQPDFRMNTSLIGQIFMVDLFRLILKSVRDIRAMKSLSMQDVPSLVAGRSVDYYFPRMKALVREKLAEAQESQSELNSKQMFIIIFKTFKARLLTVLLLIGLTQSCQFVTSYMIEKLVKAVNVSNGASYDACLFAIGLAIVTLLQVTLSHNWLRINQQTMIFFRNAFVRILYSKIAQMSSYDVKKANIGKLINLVSSDFTALEGRVGRILILMNIPIYLLTLIVMLYIRLGGFSLIGLAITLLFCPLQMLFSRMKSRMLEEKSKICDERIVMTSEIIEGIRLLKMYAWEAAFTYALRVVRNKEVRANFKLQLIEFMSSSLSQTSGLVGALITFVLVYQFGDESTLDSATIFSTFYLFWQVRFEIVGTFGYGIFGLFEMNIVLKRMISVLSLKKSTMRSIDAYPVTQSELKAGTVASLENFSAYWNRDKPVLEDLSVEFKSGDCVCVIGKVGSGKTSLLNCFLKEVPFYSGSMSQAGKLAYVEQEPYIFSTSVRENITFGLEFDEHRYNSVIESCCLVPDIQSMPSGDSTVIGERGIDISGGQKARISLARAVYSQADIYLLDDPLSAVDSKVAKKLFFGVIQNLAKVQRACVILVTHQIHFSQFTDKVILLSHGRIEAQGTFNDIRESLSDNYSALSNFMSEQSNDKSNSGEPSSNDVHSSEESTAKKLEKQTEKPNEKRLPKVNSPGRIVESSAIRFQSYAKLLTLSKKLWLIPVIIASYLASDYTFVLFNRSQKSLGEESNDRKSIFILMTTLAIGYLSLQCIRQSLLAFLMNQSAKHLHEHMIESLVRAPTSYFDTTPTGKIISFFANDLSSLDSSLSGNFQEVLSILSTFSMMTLAVLLAQPFFGLIVGLEVALLWIFVRKTSISLKATKQLDQSLRAPVFTFFNQVISGVLPIRVFEQQDRFEASFEELTNNSARAASYFFLCQRGFGAYTEGITFIASMIGVIFVLVTLSDATLISQIIIFLMTGSDEVSKGIRQMIATDVAMTNTQRCLDMELEQEAPLNTAYDSNIMRSVSSGELSRDYNDSDDIEGKSQKNSIRFKGELVFKNVKMRYRKHLDYVLKGVSFEIKPGQRIGIVGRTGAGKSSILQCLFRMVEIENEGDDSGIWIDGLNTRRMGLHTLRSGISIIPQTPFMFAGTIRRNLDPQQEYSDAQIQETLVHIGLDKKVNSLKKGMETNMTNVNSIFSIGEKQLVCLGRAILKKSKLIVLDEATANCDLHTDEFIQANLRDKFVGSTLITIAHRLNTIADYDQIIVIDQGIVVESGTPYELLEKAQGSIFGKMVQHTGDSNAQLILEIATKAYFEKKNNNNQQY